MPHVIRSFHCPASSSERRPRPKPLPGAVWQAGVTRDSSSFRPFINGEPAPLCFAASPELGVAQVYVCTGDRIRRDDAGNPIVKTITGHVELLPVDE